MGSHPAGPLLLHLPPPTQAAVLGLVAARVAAVLTQPVELVKTRLVTMENVVMGHGEGVDGRDILAMGQAVVREDGWRGLFVGPASRLPLVSIGGALYYGAADVVERLLSVQIPSR